MLIVKTISMYHIVITVLFSLRCYFYYAYNVISYFICVGIYACTSHICVCKPNISYKTLVYEYNCTRVKNHLCVIKILIKTLMLLILYAKVFSETQKVEFKNYNNNCLYSIVVVRSLRKRKVASSILARGFKKIFSNTLFTPVR